MVSQRKSQATLACISCCPIHFFPHTRWTLVRSEVFGLRVPFRCRPGPAHATAPFAWPASNPRPVRPLSPDAACMRPDVPYTTAALDVRACVGGSVSNSGFESLRNFIQDRSVRTNARAVRKNHPFVRTNRITVRTNGFAVRAVAGGVLMDRGGVRTDHRAVRAHRRSVRANLAKSWLS